MKVNMNLPPDKDASLRKSIADAFDSFNSTLSGLGSSYQGLKDQINALNVQLSEKNEQLEENLQEVDRLRRFLDSILHNLTDAVIVINVQGEIVLFNGSAEKLTGYHKDEILGKSYLEVFGDTVSERFSPVYTLRNNKPLYLEEKEFKHKSGFKLPVRYSTSLVKDNVNQVVGAVEVISDLSRMKRWEAELQRIKTQTALNQMAGLVAHEIRTPLGGVIGYVDLLSESLKDNDESQDMLTQIIDSVKRLEKTVNNFQLYAQPVKPRYEKTDLIKYLNEIIEYFNSTNQLSQKNIQTIFKVEPENDVLVATIDPLLLEQALLAVLDNAMKALPEGGVIRIQVQQKRDSLIAQENRQLCIQISDNGIGMSDEVLDQLFTPFFTTREHGTGLGLALAKNFIKIHHGDIVIQSRPDQGTSVNILLSQN